MGGKPPLDTETIERIKALLAVGKSRQRIKDELGISWSTVDKYSKIHDPELEGLRESKKREFIDAAWQDIRSAMFLGRQKIHMATVAAQQFQPMVDKLVSVLEDKDDINAKDVTELLKAMAKMTDIPLAHISTYFGTLYDKQALAQGENTVSVGGSINVVFSIPRPPAREGPPKQQAPPKQRAQEGPPAEGVTGG